MNASDIERKNRCICIGTVLHFSLEFSPPRIVSSIKDAPIGDRDISLHLSDLATEVGTSPPGFDTKWTSSCGCDSDLPFIQRYSNS